MSGIGLRLGLLGCLRRLARLGNIFRNGAFLEIDTVKDILKRGTKRGRQPVMATSMLAGHHDGPLESGEN